MKLVPRGVPIDGSNPELVFLHQVDGLMSDLYALTFSIWDATTEEKQLAPVEVVPTTIVDVSVTSGDRLGVGRYAATWDVPGSLTPGTYEIRWVYQHVSDGPARSARERFEIVPGRGLFYGPFYCGLGELRDEGLASTEMSDARALGAIMRASMFVERVTGRFFEPRYQTLLASGSGREALLLESPIIGIDDVSFESSYESAGSLLDDESALRVFNRHLVGGPDDRISPKIELYTDFGAPFVPSLGYRFGRGAKNIRVRGVFGYTDFNGSPWGATPEDIRRVTQMLVIRDVAKLRDTDGREDARLRGRLVSERTRDQSYQLTSAKELGLATGITGDPEIDQVLLAYRSSMAIGAA